MREHALALLLFSLALTRAGPSHSRPPVARKFVIHFGFAKVARSVKSIHCAQSLLSIKWTQECALLARRRARRRRRRPAIPCTRRQRPCSPLASSRRASKSLYRVAALLQACEDKFGARPRKPVNCRRWGRATIECSPGPAGRRGGHGARVDSDRPLPPCPLHCASARGETYRFGRVLVEEINLSSSRRGAQSGAKPGERGRRQ